MPPLIYAELPLDSSRDEIRLLELAPGSPDDELAATLSKASLERPRPYEALSYVWGDMTTPRLICIHNHSFPIT